MRCTRRGGTCTASVCRQECYQRGFFYGLFPAGLSFQGGFGLPFFYPRGFLRGCSFNGTGDVPGRTTRFPPLVPENPEIFFLPGMGSLRTGRSGLIVSTRHTSALTDDSRYWILYIMNDATKPTGDTDIPHPLNKPVITGAHPVLQPGQGPAPWQKPLPTVDLLGFLGW